MAIKGYGSLFCTKSESDTGLGPGIKLEVIIGYHRISTMAGPLPRQDASLPVPNHRPENFDARRR